MSRVAVVGAGVAGLAFAYAVRTLPIDVTVFEKSRGYGGRAATRGRNNTRYDHGASYFTAPSKRVERVVTAHLPTDGLVEISRPIWTFDGDGTLSRQRSGTEMMPKWTYKRGISRLGKLLAHYSQAQVRTETTIQRLEHQGDHWTVHDQDGTAFAPFEAVILTPPAPQTTEILRNSSVHSERIDRLQRQLASVRYTSQFSFILAYDRVVSRPREFYGLVNDNQDHPLRWIGFEHDKPGHVPPGNSMLIVHTSPHWTAERIDADVASFMPDIRAWTEDILVSDLRRPAWYDVHRWRYSTPQEALSTNREMVDQDRGLFFAGDYLNGEGRVGAALESGFQTAGLFRKWMKGPDNSIC